MAVMDERINVFTVTSGRFSQTKKTRERRDELLQDKIQRLGAILQ